MEKEKYSIGEVATQMGLGLIDNETKKPVSDLELLKRIANDVAEIKSNITPIQ